MFADWNPIPWFTGRPVDVLRKASRLYLFLSSFLPGNRPTFRTGPKRASFHFLVVHVFCQGKDFAADTTLPTVYHPIRVKDLFVSILSKIYRLSKGSESP